MELRSLEVIFQEAEKVQREENKTRWVENTTGTLEIDAMQW